MNDDVKQQQTVKEEITFKIITQHNAIQFLVIPTRNEFAFASELLFST